MGKKQITGHSTWTLTENPLFMTTCPHCKNIIFMGKESLITRLKKWAKMLKEI